VRQQPPSHRDAAERPPAGKIKYLLLLRNKNTISMPNFSPRINRGNRNLWPQKYSPPNAHLIILRFGEYFLVYFVQSLHSMH
jgi:hypothetical protein